MSITRRFREMPDWRGRDIGRWVEIALLAGLTVQVARLAWALATPVGAFGGWVQKMPAIPGAAARQALLTGFDPFNRAVAVIPAGGTVTALALKLYGIRLNEGSGGGSAIIAASDGIQNSFAVGDAILPGVTLKAVAFDHVVITRGGADENLFIDQSSPATLVGGGPISGPAPAPGGLTVARVNAEIAFAPRTQGARITGITVSPKGGSAYQDVGFQPGDTIVQVNGRPVATPEDLGALLASVTPGARIALMVERGGAVVPMTIMVQP